MVTGSPDGIAVVIAAGSDGVPVASRMANPGSRVIHQCGEQGAGEYKSRSTTGRGRTLSPHVVQTEADDCSKAPEHLQRKPSREGHSQRAECGSRRRKGRGIWVDRASKTRYGPRESTVAAKNNTDASCVRGLRLERHMRNPTRTRTRTPMYPSTSSGLLPIRKGPNLFGIRSHHQVVCRRLHPERHMLKWPWNDETEHIVPGLDSEDRNGSLDVLNVEGRLPASKRDRPPARLLRGALQKGAGSSHDRTLEISCG